MQVIALDVTDSTSIAAAVKATAITGFTESLALELADFNVRVKLVEPGYGPSTRFTQNGGSRMQGLLPEPYAPFAERIFAGSRSRLR